jgi:hypothetical protein
MKQTTTNHVQGHDAKAKSKTKEKAGKKTNHSDLQGDERIGGKVRQKAG